MEKMNYIKYVINHAWESASSFAKKHWGVSANRGARLAVRLMETHPQYVQHITAGRGIYLIRTDCDIDPRKSGRGPSKKPKKPKKK